MKNYGLILALSLSACSKLHGAEQRFAQCRLEAYEPRGLEFRQDFIGNPPAQSTEQQALDWFLITCMESKGYDFAEPFIGSRGEINTRCWYKRPDESIDPMPLGGGYRCFSRSLW
jgi:hypothetical protein